MLPYAYLQKNTRIREQRKDRLKKSNWISKTEVRCLVSELSMFNAALDHRIADRRQQVRGRKGMDMFRWLVSGNLRPDA